MSDEAKQWVAEVFDRAAPTYDRVGDSYHDAFGARLVEFAEIPTGAAVLDVACGRGAVLIPAARRVGVSGRVVGIDISPAMIGEAEVALAAADVRNVVVRVMDAEHLDFDDDSFDFVMCAFGVFFFRDPQQAVAEIRRVLRPGGVLALSSWADEDERWAWDDDLLAAFDVPRRVVAHPFDTPSDLEQLPSEGGLVDIHVQLEQRTISFASEEEWWDWKWSFSIRGVLEQISDAARDDYKRAAFAQMRAVREPNGFPMQLTVCFALGRRSEK